MEVNHVLLLINALFTTFCGGYILYLTLLKRVERHEFYYLFSSGFIVYGIEISMRWLFPNLGLHAIFGGLFGVSLFFFSMGLWSLSRKKSLLVVVVVCFLIAYLLVGAWVANLISFEEGYPISLCVAYLPLIVLLIYNTAMLGKIADRFIFGWFLLLLANFVLVGLGWIIDVFAVFSKVVILLGIKDQDFIIITQRIRREMAYHPISAELGYEEEGKLILVIQPPKSSYLSKVQWVNRKIQKNIEEGVDTQVFSFQDVIPHEALRRMKWINPEKVSVFLFSTSAEKAKKEFTVLRMGITKIGAALSEVIKTYFQIEKGCTVIFMNLSLLIHIFGAYPVYRMLLNKMGSLREAGVNLFSFFHPETHGDKSVVSLFTNISDEVIQL